MAILVARIIYRMKRFLAFGQQESNHELRRSISPTTNHGDALVVRLQRWLQTHYMVASPVEELSRLAALPRRSVERRFARATGHSPIAYVQALS